MSIEIEYKNFFMISLFLVLCRDQAVKSFKHVIDRADIIVYEDENDNYNYEKGLYPTIGFKWNNTTPTLSTLFCRS